MYEPRNSILTTALLALLLLGSGMALAQHDHGQSTTDRAEAAPPLFGGLGDHHLTVTVSDEARPYFDQGLAFVYGFDHAESVRAFREAARLDPSCAMCHWGVALALGPHINAAMMPDAVEPAVAAIERAQELAASVSERERAFIDALAVRYVSEAPEDRSTLDHAYADAMRELSAAYPDDLDAATLFAEALMILMPWDYWQADGDPRPATVELLATLEAVMDRDPYHPGANHLYIHAIEASNEPERAEGAADRLVELGIQIGHMLHMPSHIFARVGRWHDASSANERAVEADSAYFAAVEAEGLVPVLYHPHNLHFLAWTAGMEGRSELALQAANDTADAAITELAHDLLLINAFLTMPVQTMVRFEAWSDILAGGPRDGAHAFEIAAWHYAHGRAHVAAGDLVSARAQADALAAIADGPDAAAMEQPEMFFPGASMLAIARAVLDAHLARADGDLGTAIAALQRAVDGHDALPYFEPPHWFVSPRIDLGWMLLEADRPADAEVVFRDDLGVYAENGWALYGLAESLRAQGAEEAAADVDARFEEAWRHADASARPGTRAVEASRR
jgi:tetratricopeptide (TPR) repeat protein